VKSSVQLYSQLNVKPLKSVSDRQAGRRESGGEIPVSLCNMTSGGKVGLVASAIENMALAEKAKRQLKARACLAGAAAAAAAAGQRGGGEEEKEEGGFGFLVHCSTYLAERWHLRRVVA